MNEYMIPAEVIAYFDLHGRITPCRIRYEKDGIKVMQISRLLRRERNIFSGNIVEIYKCIAVKNDREIMLVLTFEKEIDKWFLSKL